MPETRHRRRLATLLAVTALLLSTVGLGSAPAGAALPPAGYGQITVLHGIPGTTVDVYLNGGMFIEDFPTGGQVGPQPLWASTYEITVYAAGADPAVTDPILWVDLPVPDGVDMTLVATLDPDGTADLLVFENDLSPTSPGMARLVARHAAEAGPVDLWVDGEVLVDDLPYEGQEHRSLTADTYAIAFADAGGMIADLGSPALEAGQYVEVYLVGSEASLFPIMRIRDVGEDTDPPPPAPAFPDVPEGHQFYVQITWMAQQGITTGYVDGTFRPANPLTRQAMAAFLYRLAGSPYGTDPGCTAAQFPDVPVDHPFCGEIGWMVAEGITTGYDDGTFKPASTITRQAMSAFVYRLAGSPLGADPQCALAPFPDVAADHPFCGEIDWMVEAGIATGYEDGTFRPGVDLSRQAASAFLYVIGNAG